ncbi:MAG TPA: hypothetical protein VFI11_08180 [Anaerolineales bacterium]|nr:hypothetical protein [Anaerolineales bacterium]
MPYIWAMFRQGEAWHFTGFLFGVEDGNSYIAKMLAGSYGAWLFRTPYTTAPQTGILAFLPYLLLGKLASGPALHDQLVALFHLARVAATFVGVLATYRFASRFLPDEPSRRWSTLLATVGGGLGWLLVVIGRGSLLGSLPLDFYSPETFGFLAYLGLPHLIVGRALLLTCLGWFLDAAEREDRAAWAGAGLLALGLFQPLAVVSAWAVIGAYIVLEAVVGGQPHMELGRRVGTASKVVLFSSPVVVYYGLLGSTDPFAREWTAQNIIRSPHPVHYAIAYGLLLAVALTGWRLLRSGGPSLMLAGWILLLPLLAYAPIDLQRRLPDGVWVAIVIMAAAAVRTWKPHQARRGRVALAAVSLPSSLILVVGALRAASTPGYPAFVPTESVSAFEALAERARPGDAVMASFESGNILPAWVPVHVPIGHGPESIGLRDLRGEVSRFFDADTDDDERLQFLTEHDIRFVFAGPWERQLGDWDPASEGYLLGLYSGGDYAIYGVAIPDDCGCGEEKGG